MKYHCIALLNFLAQILLAADANLLFHPSDRDSGLLLGRVVEKCLVRRYNVPVDVLSERDLAG